MPVCRKDVLTLIGSDDNNCYCFLINTDCIKGVAMSRIITFVIHKYLV